MEMNEKHQSYRFLMLIANPKLADKAAEMFKSGALPLQYKLSVRGTASSEIMDALGLGSIDKTLLASMMPKDYADEMLYKLRRELRLGTINSGIAFTIPITGANSHLLQIVSSIEDHEITPIKRKESSIMTEVKHTLVVAVVNKGFSEDVMAAARGAGAGGGTVISGRRIGNEEVKSFWGLSVQDEKEVLMIIADNENKVKIMHEISEKCGINSEAKGMVISMPIDSVIGLDDFD